MKTYDIRYLPEGKTYKHLLNRGKSKMKKVLTIGLMLLVCAGFVFAATQEKTDTLTVTVNIEKETYVDWFNVEPNISSDWTSEDSDTATISLGGLSDWYAAVKTNNNNVTKITISANPLSGGNSEYLEYTITPSSTASADASSEDKVTISDSTNDSVVTFSPKEDYMTGARTFYGKITIEIPSAESNTHNASVSADNYTATITMTIDGDDVQS